MRPGDSVYREDLHVAHAVDIIEEDRIRTACGRYFTKKESIPNRGQKRPCEMCVRVIEERIQA